MTRAYTITVSAQSISRPGFIDYSVGGGVVLANSDGEAARKATRMGEKAFPALDGFFNHSSQASALPKRTIDAICECVDEYGHN